MIRILTGNVKIIILEHNQNRYYLGAAHPLFKDYIPVENDKGQPVLDAEGNPTTEAIPMLWVDTARFIKAVKTKTVTAGEKKTRVREDGTMSAINAAHKVLTEEQRAMTVKEIYETAVEKGYCRLAGTTPMLTIYGISSNEIKKRGSESRFRKTGRGLFDAR